MPSYHTYFWAKKSNLRSIFKNIFVKSRTSAPEVKKFNVIFLKKFAKTPPMPPDHLYFCVNNPNLKADFENNFPKSRTAVQKKILPKKYEHPNYNDDNEGYVQLIDFKI